MSVRLGVEIMSTSTSWPRSSPRLQGFPSSFFTLYGTHLHMDNNPKKMFTDHQHKGKESDAKINRKI
jgi:hypothetical protein